MNKLIFGFCSLVLCFGLTACDKNENDDNCDSEVISDYNDIVFTCRSMNTTSDISDCKSTAQSFINKYPGINCEAARTSSRSVDSDRFYITEGSVQNIITAVEAQESKISKAREDDIQAKRDKLLDDIRKTDDITDSIRKIEEDINTKDN